jgi:hypothetical protein
LSAAEKYDITSLRPGSVEGMKRRKSLYGILLGVLRRQRDRHIDRRGDYCILPPFFEREGAIAVDIYLGKEAIQLSPGDCNAGTRKGLSELIFV